LRRKISVIGAGNVGATIALYLSSKRLADILLLDVAAGTAQGKALDILQAGSIFMSDSMLVGTCDYEDVRGSEIVIITAGIPRKPGMSRDDLLKTNASIVAESARNIARVAPDSMIILVTNPLDAMAYVAKEVSGFPAERVFGMAGVLDSARFSCFIAKEVGVSVESIQTMILGGHGDTMVPLLSYTTIAGIPISHFLSEDVIEKLVDRARNGGAEIVGHLKTGSAFYAPAASVVDMVESIFLDKKKILPVAAFLSGQYGAKDIYLGVPVKLGAAGVEEILEVPLTDEENISLQKSITAVEGLTKSLDVDSLRSA